MHQSPLHTILTTNTLLLQRPIRIQTEHHHIRLDFQASQKMTCAEDVETPVTTNNLSHDSFHQDDQIPWISEI